LEEIAAASREQAHGIEQLNKAVAEIDGVTQQTSANAEESAAASGQMSGHAQQMKEFVASLITLVGGNGKRHSMPSGPRKVLSRSGAAGAVGNGTVQTTTS